jgi:hypothetical protein
MLIKLYQDEDKRFGVTYHEGILKNLDRPLNPNDSYNLRKAPQSQNMGNTQRSHMDSINMPQSASGEVGIIGGSGAHDTSNGSMNMTNKSQMTQGNKASK